MPKRRSRLHVLLGALFVAPAAHPLLIPVIGVPSHLLWWLHVLPVALAAFWYGRRAAAATVLLSLAALVVGERLFGAGYGSPATWHTALSLAVALFGTHLLVAGFALYARSTTQRYQLLFDNTAAAILRTGPSGRVIAANPAARRTFHCSWEDVRGKSFDQIPWLRQLPPPETLAETGWSGTITVGDVGEESTLHVTVVVAGGDEAPGYQILFFDRTDDVVRDRELERQGRLAALGTTLAGVAHELKNPLQVISGYATLALDPESTPEETKESLEAIHAQGRRMDDLVRELLGFSRQEDATARVPVDDLVRDVVKIQRLALGRATRLQEHIRWSGDLAVDGPKVEQILVNLVSNAVDAAPKGSGVVDVELHAEEGDALITVADNGPGVDPELVDRIFEPFVSTKGRGQGTGLGLAICKRLASSMGARISVANRPDPDTGAVFTLRIPMAPPPLGEGNDDVRSEMRRSAGPGTLEPLAPREPVERREGAA